MSLDPRLVTVALEEAPRLLGLLREAFAARHPDALAPTNEEIIIAYQQALTASLAQDARWLAAHPDPLP